MADAFGVLGLDLREHVAVSQSLYRLTDVAIGKGNPKKAKQKLSWEASSKIPGCSA